MSIQLLKIFRTNKSELNIVVTKKNDEQIQETERSYFDTTIRSTPLTLSCIIRTFQIRNSRRKGDIRDTKGRYNQGSFSYAQDCGYT